MLHAVTQFAISTGQRSIEVSTCQLITSAVVLYWGCLPAVWVCSSDLSGQRSETQTLPAKLSAWLWKLIWRVCTYVCASDDAFERCILVHLAFQLCLVHSRNVKAEAGFIIRTLSAKDGLEYKKSHLLRKQIDSQKAFFSPWALTFNKSQKGLLWGMYFREKQTRNNLKLFSSSCTFFSFPFSSIPSAVSTWH